MMKQLPTESKKFDLKNWCIENKAYLLLIISIYQVAVLSIGIINFPYLDDNARQVAGMTDFGTTYARWGSEFLSWFVQGSRHLTDLGLTTPILTGLILSLTSILAIYIINDQKISWGSSLVATLIGLNPWFLQCLSFRFDSPYMALSIFCSFLPFYWWQRNSFTFFLVSVFSLFVMFNTYQASSGIYIVIVLFLTFKQLLAGENFIALCKKVALAAIAYLLSIVSYLIELKFVPSATNNIGGSQALPSLHDIPSVAYQNSYHYFSELLNQSNRLWLLLLLLLLVLFFISHLSNSKINLGLSFLYCILYLGLASLLSFGIFIVYSRNIAGDAPRYIYGFAVFVTISMLSLFNNRQVKAIYLTSLLVASLLSYYILSFVLVYSSTLNYQKEAFNRQAAILTDDLKNVVTNERKKVYLNTFFKNSTVYANTSRNYPILSKIVPPNDGLYFPNYVWFNTSSNLGVEMAPLTDTDMSKNQKVVSNHFYDIYTNNKEIFVFMK